MSLASIRKRKRRGFRSALLSVSARCVIGCKFCFRAERGSRELSIATLSRALSRLHELGVREVCLTGGEPTHHEAFSDIVRITRQFGIACSVITAAQDSAASDQLFEVDHLLQCVTVSVDSQNAAQLGSTRRLLQNAITTVERLRSVNTVVHFTYYDLVADEVSALCRAMRSAEFQLEVSPLLLSDSFLHRFDIDREAYRAQLVSDAKLLDNALGMEKGAIALAHLYGNNTLDSRRCTSRRLFVESGGDIKLCPYGSPVTNVFEPRNVIVNFLTAADDNRARSSELRCRGLCDPAVRK